MKVLIAAKYSSVYGGNFIPSVESFAKYCKAKGDEIGFAFPAEAKKRQWCINLGKKYPVYFIENHKNITEAKKMNQYIKSQQYDCLYVHFSLGLVFPLSLMNPSLAIVRHTHTDMGEVPTLKSKIRMWLKRSIFYSRMSHIYVSKRLQAIEKMESKKNSCFLPNALAVSRFSMDKFPEYRTEMRHELHISDDDKVILMFGWHIKVKGVDIALQAFEKVIQREPKSRLLIVLGENMSSDFAMKYVTPETLEHVCFLPPTQDIERYHATADIFLSSSRSEGFSYSIMEALYFGRYVVTSNLEAVQWSLKYKTVSAFESENVDDCAQKLCNVIERAYANPDSHEQDETQERLNEDYSIEKWDEAVYGVLKNQYQRKVKQR